MKSSILLYSLSPRGEAKYRVESNNVMNWRQMHCAACRKPFSAGPGKVASTRCSKCVLRGLV